MSDADLKIFFFSLNLCRMQPPGAEDSEEDDGFEMFGDSAMEGETFYRGNDATLNEIAAQMKGSQSYLLYLLSLLCACWITRSFFAISYRVIPGIASRSGSQ